MLKFLKKIFHKEEEILTQEVKRDDLRSWVENKVASNDMAPQATEFLRRVREQKELIAQKLLLLEEASINKKHKVEERVRNIVKGHRDNYVKAVRRFVENLDLPQENRDAVRTFSELLKKDLDELSKRTAKNNEAARHLFYDQVEAVFDCLREMALASRDFDLAVEKAGIDKVGKIKEMIQSLDNARKAREDLKRDLQEREVNVQGLREEQQKLKDQLAVMGEGDKFKQLLDLKKKQADVDQVIIASKNQIHQYFSKLGRALRKYEKITLHHKLVHKYVDDALIAFFGDTDLIILEVLEGLKKSLMNNDIEVKQKDQLLELLGNSQILKELKGKVEDLGSESDAIQAKLDESTLEEEMNKKRVHVRDIEKAVREAGVDIEKDSAKLAMPHDQDILENIKKLVKEAFKIELKII